MWASVLDRGECGPIAQLKGASGLLKIRRGKVAQMQAIAGGEYQMIETAKFLKEGCDGFFVRDVDRLPLCFATDTLNRLLNSFRIARDDNDLGSLRGRLLLLSQPAVSRALQRARAMFQDDLLLRSPHGFELTLRGRKILQELEGLLPRMENLVTPNVFNPKCWIAMSRQASRMERAEKRTP